MHAKGHYFGVWAHMKRSKILKGKSINQQNDASGLTLKILLLATFV